MESFVSNSVVADTKNPSLLFDFNNSPLPKIVTPAPINMNNNVDLGYSIISNNAEKLNEILNDPNTSVSNMRSVIFTRHINCSLVADQLNPEYGSIKKWKICNPTNDYKRVIYAGPSNNTSISNNMELYIQQLMGMEKSIRCWCSQYLYPSGFATQAINHDMSKYSVFLGKSKNGSQNARQFHSCYELIKNLKNSVNKNNLKSIPRFEAIDCKNLQWTNYNKFTDTAVIDTVEQIVNPTVRTKETDPLYFDDVKFNNNYYNSIDNCCWSTDPDDPCGNTGLQKHFDCVGENGYDACTNNANAITFFPFLTTTANNFVNLQHVVYVDPFKENETVYCEEPVLLKLIFNTQFYYNYEKLPTTITDETEPCVLRWNPSPCVYMPEPAEYFLLDEDEDISCCT